MQIFTQLGQSAKPQGQATELETNSIAWGLRPLARRKGSLALDRDGLPSLPRGCVFLTLAKSFDPLVQAG
ncbi:hypothetical protein JP74_10820 [Devosia sp. 17-2-E-8]|nr:hypothetical protein JP74_10820 [Devosia sp. 17-2-E-8]